MTSYRRFIIFIIGLLLVFVAINAVIWFGWVREIVGTAAEGGDLVRMGYIGGCRIPRDNSIDLPRQHYDIRQYDHRPVDIVTVGDSFSVGGGYGHNRFYQDYLASFSGLRVLNVPSYQHSGKELKFNPVATLAKLVNSGYLDSMKPRYLLLETIERYAIPRFTVDFSLNEYATIADIDHYFRATTFKLASDEVGELKFINNGNWKFLANLIQYHLRDRARGSKVLMTRLSKPLFSSSRKRQLLFYQDDLNATAQATAANVALLNDNLNRLAALLHKKGITLVFMPVVDKFDLYYPYILANTYPENHFFEELRPLKKQYLFIDTKEILARLVRQGELDVFFPDDTHWSWKAPQAIFACDRFWQAHP